MLHQGPVVFDPERVAALAPAERRVAEFLELGDPRLWF